MPTMSKASEPTPCASPRRIVHLTSVHNALDNRVFEKECVSFAEAGFNTSFVVPDDGPDRILKGVHLLTVPKPRNRFIRMAHTTSQVVSRALKENADLYIFHDPELIPQALRLRLHSKPVIFDVHEDYYTSITEKSSYLPQIIAQPTALGYVLCEKLARSVFSTIIAERYYIRRFPKALPVLNYPRLEQFQSILDVRSLKPPSTPRLLYTGGLSVERGALIYAELARLLPDGEVHLVGICPSSLADQIHIRAEEGTSRLHLEGVNEKLPFHRILEAYRQPWTCGMAIMPNSAHYREKELTKFFEYMAAGLPIIASDFPVWKSLIEGQKVGLCVDPNSPDAIIDAVRWLVAHPEEALAMGERGRNAVRSTFNWNKEAEKLISLARKLTQSAA